MGTGRASPVSRGKADHISYFSLTAGGALTALSLRDRFGGTAYLPRCQSLGCGHCSPFDNLAETLPERFLAGDTVVAVMAAGIVFRLLAPHLSTKHVDPAVIVLDEEGRHAIPLLGGHAAGANDLARDMAAYLGGEAAITTSSDVQGLTAPDEVARLLDCRVAGQDELRRVTALLVDGNRLCIQATRDPGIDGYDWMPSGAEPRGYAGRLLITNPSVRDAEPYEDMIPTARLVPRVVCAGVGCRRGVAPGKVISAVYEACSAAGIDPLSLSSLASIDVKKDEAGLEEAARELDVELIFYTASQLGALGRPGRDFVAAKVGTPAVSEPAALLGAGAGSELVAAKSVHGPVTVALALKPRPAPRSVPPRVGPRPAPMPAASGQAESRPAGCGQVLAVGIGAGTSGLLTAEAAAAIENADVVVGYRTYIDQVRRIFPEKKYLAGSMGREVNRCREALNLAREGKTVALISSGDPGVYGMAGPLLEVAGHVPVRILPGVSAAHIAAARLGAPLMNDFIVLSLSDLLTPREEVLRRAAAAAASDMVICLYNPTSRKRRPLFEEACDILLEHRLPETPVGWVREAGGPGEKAAIVNLGQLSGQDIDMRTAVIIGNSRTEIIDGKMVTRRGYRKES
ncbi:MAG: precorrin-3B C(17)-methyltransferase [Thermoleophilia bacterium]|nr:precorrin-3B C(17)-methyltransferase [Thermoleophilia bacterium]